MEIFQLYSDGERQMIRRNVPPRFVGEVTFGPLSDIEHVTFLDELPGAMEAARAMREAGEFLLSVSRGNENHRERIGASIRRLRTEKGMSLRELAEKSGVNHSNIVKIEAGRYNVSIDILNRICDALGAEIDIKEL